MKVSIIGVGRVGSTVAYTLTMRGLGDELVLVNRRRQVAEGEAFDLQHALSFTDKPMTIRAGEVADTAGSDIVILCASVPTPPDITDRLALGPANAKLFDALIPPLAEASPRAILIVVSNPVDVLTHRTLILSHFEPTRVIGAGTLIDSARLRTMLSERVGIHPDDVRAYILGEHGASQFPAFSLARAGGAKLDERIANHALFEQAVDAGVRVFRHKGYTNYAISMATALIVDSIVHDARRTMPVSVRIDGWLGVSDVCLSVPAVVGRAGVTKVLTPELSDAEAAAFRRSAEVVREAIARCG